MVYLQLCYTFFKVGLFGFGGGYAILSLIQHEAVVRHGWITARQFTDIVAISQTTPGPISINSATYIGYAATGSAWGAAVATLALMLPSFIVMLGVCRVLVQAKNNRYLAAALLGLRPAVAGLIAAAALTLLTSGSVADPTGALLFALAFIASWRYRLHPILIIALAGAAGVVLG